MTGRNTIGCAGAVMSIQIFNAACLLSGDCGNAAGPGAAGITRPRPSCASRARSDRRTARVRTVGPASLPERHAGQPPARMRLRRTDAAAGGVVRLDGVTSSNLRHMPATPSSSEPTPQRLAAIRDQLKLLADYL